MNDPVLNVLTIIVPSLVAVLSLLFQYLSNRTNTKNERLKIFYNDRLAAFKEINQTVSRIEQSMEATLNFKHVMRGKIAFYDIVANRNNAIPPEIFQTFQSNLYGCTLIGRDSFLKCIENNKLFINDGIEQVINEMKNEYLFILPEPLYPETIDKFLENKIAVVKKISNEMVIECRKALMINK